MKDQVAHLVGLGSASNIKGKPSRAKKGHEFHERTRKSIYKEKKCVFSNGEEVFILK